MAEPIKIRPRYMATVLVEDHPNKDQYDLHYYDLAPDTINRIADAVVERLRPKNEEPLSAQDPLKLGE